MYMSVQWYGNKKVVVTEAHPRSRECLEVVSGAHPVCTERERWYLLSHLAMQLESVYVSPLILKGRGQRIAEVVP